MQLGNLRQRVKSRVQRGNVTFPPVDIDFAIQAALNELDLDDYFALVYTDAATMAANNPEVDISGLLPDISGSLVAGVRPERVMRCELAYTDEGVWASGTSYQREDLVQGDGDPDSYFYRCTAANTASASNEPGSDGGNNYWARVLWKHGNNLELVNRDTIARYLGDRPNIMPFLPMGYVFVQDATTLPGRPAKAAFLTQDILLVWPPPDYAYKVRFLVQYPITEFEAGQSAETDIDIPDNILIPAIGGMCYWLDQSHPQSANWRAQFDLHKKKVMGLTIVDAGPAQRDPSAYMDVTDGYGPLTMRTYYPWGTQ